jgi:hypothetical protein
MTIDIINLELSVFLLVNFYLISNWSPRLYCEYAVTNDPAKVIGIEPSTIPDNNASTIKVRRYLIRILTKAS